MNTLTFSDPTSETVPVEEALMRTESIAGVKGSPVLTLERPSLETFRAEHFSSRIPVKLTSTFHFYYIKAQQMNKQG